MHILPNGVQIPTHVVQMDVKNLPSQVHIGCECIVEGHRLHIAKPNDLKEVEANLCRWNETDTSNAKSAGLENATCPVCFQQERSTTLKHAGCNVAMILC